MIWYGEGGLVNNLQKGLFVRTTDHFDITHIKKSLESQSSSKCKKILHSESLDLCNVN